MKISSISAREILDSRGNPTLEVDVRTTDGNFARAAVPSGASTGEFESLELRDGGERFNGKGVLSAVKNIQETIAPELIHKSFHDPKSLDDLLLELDGTEDKSRLGANTVLGMSLAGAKAMAADSRMQLFDFIRTVHGGNQASVLPLPLINVLNGGAHAYKSTSVQEFMLIPHGAEDFYSAIEISSKVFRQLAYNLRAKNYSTAVGDEGGFVPMITSDTEAIELLVEAVSDSGYIPGETISLGLDVAASELFRDGRYHLDGEAYSTEEMIDWLEGLTDKYPIISIEDGLDENDWNGWAALRSRLASNVQLVGDDLLVTNTDRLSKGIEKSAADSILIKPNQIGTLSETLEAISTAQDAGWECIVSHRSGETNDTTIAHLAVGTGSSQIKTGSLNRGERVEKYNELFRISEIIESSRMANPFDAKPESG